MAEINDRLREARQVAYPGATLAVVSAHVGLDASTISRAERHADPRASALPRYAAAYGCDIAWIVTGSGRRPRKARAG